MYRPIRQATHSSTSGLLIPSNNSPTPSLLYIISSLLTTSPPSVSATKSCAHSTNQSGSHYYSPSSVSSVISSMRVITEYSTTSPHRRPTCAPFNSTNLTFRAPRFYLSANSATNTTLSFSLRACRTYKPCMLLSNLWGAKRWIGYPLQRPGLPRYAQHAAGISKTNSLDPLSTPLRVAGLIDELDLSLPKAIVSTQNASLQNNTLTQINHSR